DFRVVDEHTYTGLFGGEIFCDIEAQLDGDDSVLTFKVHAFFFKDSGWLKLYTGKNLSDFEAAANADWIRSGLIHEQAHFDIAECWARRIRKLINDSARTCNENEISNKIILLRNSHYKEQVAFDAQTKHGLDSMVQKKWLKRINATLDSFYLYEQPAGKLLLK